MEKDVDKIYLGPRIETTVGDLICAIHDAAIESSIKEEDLAEITKLIFDGLANKK